MALAVVALCLLQGPLALAQDILQALTGEAKAAEKAMSQQEAHSTFFPEPLEFPQEDEAFWNEFFAQKPIGFGLDTFQRLPEVALELVEPLLQWWPRFRQDPLHEASSLLPVVLILALLTLLFVLDRRVDRLTAPLLKRGRAWLPEWSHKYLGAAMELIQSTLPVVAIQAVVWVMTSFMGTVDHIAAVLLQESLGLLLLYRGLRSVVVAVFSGDLLEIEAQKVVQLQKLLLLSLKVLVVLNILLLVVDDLKLGQDIYALLWVGLQLTLVAAVLRLATLKQQVMTLLPEDQDSVLWNTFRENLERQYHLYLVATIALLVLWGIGYENAALFLLIRGYAIVALVSVTVGLQQRVHRWLVTRSAATHDEEKRQSYENLDRLLGLGSFLVLVVMVLVLLGLWPYAETLINYTLLRTSTLKLSLHNLGAAGLSLGLFLLLSRLLRAWLSEHFYPRLRLDISVGYTINTIVHYLLLAAGLAAALDSLGLDLSAAVVFFTAFSVGIGFGLQDIARNFVSGFILLFGRSIRKGDWVQVEDDIGRVDDLGGRMVRLVTVDNTEILLPASRMIEGKVTNLTYATPRIRLRIPVGVHYKSDIRQVEQALLHAALRHRAVLRTPAPLVLLNGFGDSSVDFSLLVWIDVRQIEPRRLKGELNFHIWDIFQEQGIEIPYPQRDLYLKPDPGLQEVIRALRGEPPAEKPAASHKAPEPLPQLDSYLTRYDANPNVISADTLDHLVGALHLVGFSSERTQAIERMVRSFAESNQETLEKLSSDTAAYLEQVEIKLETPSLDKI